MLITHAEDKQTDWLTSSPTFPMTRPAVVISSHYDHYLTCSLHRRVSISIDIYATFSFYCLKQRSYRYELDKKTNALHC